MNTFKIVIFSLMTVFCTTAQAQVNPGNHPIRTISGTITNTDFAGNTITILADDQHQMSFYVPENAIINRGTKDIGLMEIKVGHPVTIQYDNSSPGKNIVNSIVDNKPAAQE